MPEYKVALYCRVANADQLTGEEQSSIERQKACLLHYAKANGLDRYPMETYMDNGYSGMNFDRPALAKLEQDMREGIVGAVVVKDISRIGRNFLETGDWLRKLHDNGIVFVEANSSPIENIRRNRGCFTKFMEGGADRGRKNRADRKVRQTAFRG